MSFYDAISKASKLKFGQLRQMYVLAKEIVESLDADQKTAISVALMGILTPEQAIKGMELYGMWKDLWKKEEA